VREPHGTHPVDISWIGWEAGVPLLPLEELLMIAALAVSVVLVLGMIFILIEFKKTKTGMSRQQIFDTVKNGLLAQGKKSTNENKYCCQYRGIGNTKCAVGFLIPDSMYTKDMEVTCFSMNPIKGALEVTLNRPMTWEDERLINDLLNVHDIHGPDLWPYELRKVASMHGLRA
jgi:hypothetical protein